MRPTPSADSTKEYLAGCLESYQEAAGPVGSSWRNLLPMKGFPLFVGEAKFRQ